jgi:hypothetical protein
VEHGFGNQRGAGATAEAGFAGGPVNPTLPGTEIAVYITHKGYPFKKQL